MTSKAAKKQRIILELRLSRSLTNRAISTVSGNKSSYFNIDNSYLAVPIQPADKKIQLSLETTQHQSALVRGTIDSLHFEELNVVPHAINAYLDSDIRPFNNLNDLPQHDDWLIDIRSESPSDCPIPPCDCVSSEAHGRLLDVAESVGANLLWQNGINGDNVVVGIVDAGISAEGRMDFGWPTLVPRVIGGWPNENWGTIANWRRHGNMLATDVLGIAPNASLYDIRISDSSANGGRMSDAIAGIHWAIEKYRETGTPQILCCGWGIYQQEHDLKYATDPTHPLTRKIIEAMDEGIIVLFAAGNGGQCCPAILCGTDIGPGKSIWGANGHPRVMTVGAVNKDEQLIGYSSQGPAALDEYKPDFCGISHFAGYFASDSGTSAACAVAAGVVALLKQARPTLTQEAVKRLLKSTAKDIGPPGWDRHSGSGIIQAQAAYEALVGKSAARAADMARFQKLEEENRHLKELFVELALEKRVEAARSAE
jgi:serine protease AprX